MRNTILCLGGISFFITSLVLACQPNVSIQTAQYAANGQKLYATHCQNCHGAKGEGLGTLYPPLTDTVYLRNNRDRLASIVKNGMNEPIIIQGRTFEGPMPGLAQLNDIDIAYILTYITTTFGNSTQTYSQEEVEKSLSDHKK